MRKVITGVVILLVGGTIASVLMFNFLGDKDGEAQSIEKTVENSYETPDITTDLKDGSFVRIQFQILTDSKEAKTEIAHRDFQLKNILIKELATMDEEAFKSGLDDLEVTVKEKLNEVMTDGEITDVYTISKILQ